MELTEALKKVYKQTAELLNGSDRRMFMAKIVKSLGKGGQSQAERELGWNRVTIRKGIEELESGQPYEDNFSARGRKRADYHLPNLLADIEIIVDGQSQTDPTFATHQLYTRLSAAQVRQLLIEQKGYTSSELPSEETIRKRLNELGYQLRSVQKSRPKKKIEQTDAIFEQLNQLHTLARSDPTVLRISIDAKAAVAIGPYSRRGQSRVEVVAVDHDFAPEVKVTPFGIFLPDNSKLYLYFTQGPVTSDFIVDCLIDFWTENQPKYPEVLTLLINSDNGPECHSRRTQFMQRMTAFSDQFAIEVFLAYYPPYHSKYNPVERVFGVLERHWNGAILSRISTAINFAKTMTYNHVSPLVKWVKRSYQTGVKLTAKQMQTLETRLIRHEDLPKWFVRIPPVSI